MITSNQIWHICRYKAPTIYADIPSGEVDTFAREVASIVTAQMEDALAAMLPGPYYMDPPDGSSVTVLEQVRRMSEDAARWRYLVSQHEAPSPDVLCVFAPGANLRLVPVGSMPGELEAFVDTARKL